MNLSPHSISSHAARYSAKPAEAATDSAGAEEPSAEFAELFAGLAERGNGEGPKNEAPRTEAPAKSQRAETHAVRPRARTEEEKKTSKPKPDENLMFAIGVPVAQPVDQVEVDGDEILEDPETAVPGEAEGDVALPVAASGEELVPALLDAQVDAVDCEKFAIDQPALDKAVPTAERAERDDQKNFFGDVADAADVPLTREVPQEEPVKNGVTPTPVKRGAPKSSGDADRTAADFADFENVAPIATEKPATTSERNFLSHADNEVTPRTEARGINVAKAAASMNQPASPHELASLLSKPVATHEVSAPSSFETKNPPVTQGVALSGPHQAVSAAMEAGERLKSGGQRAVDLQFSFGSEDLSVRVELHEGRVRATFRTDSAELRGALAQEWQVLHAAGADRGKRFADPVFAANSSSSAAGDHSEKRGGRDQNMHASAERFEISNSRSGSAPAAARTVAPAMASQTAVPLTARRLHTFA